MTIRFNLLGYTLASIDFDLGDHPAQTLVLGPRPPIVNTFVKRMSNGWVKRMMA